MTFRDEATLRDALNGLTPRLRRYARGLTGGSAAQSELADDLVHATLMRALGARHVGAATDLSIRLYATVTQLNRELAVTGRQARVAGAGPVLVRPGRGSALHQQSRLTAGLMSLTLESREALLLVGLEGFDHTEAARILRISRGALMNRLTQARLALDDALQNAPKTAPVSSVESRTAKSTPVRLASTSTPKQAHGHLRLVSSRS